MTALRTPDTLRLAFYGDDFTGSTDALEVLAFAGLRCALFLAVPSQGTAAITSLACRFAKTPYNN